MSWPRACAVRTERSLVRRVAALALLAGVAACGGQDRGPAATGFRDDNPDGMNGAVLTEPYTVPDASLTRTDGSSFSLTEDTTAPMTLVFFGYTHCPDICQMVMSDIASAVSRLTPADRHKVDVLFVTTDPARDDPAALRTYLDRFNPAFEGLTGDLRTIEKVASRLGVAVEKGAKMPSGGYEVVHGTQVVAVDDRDRSPIVWTEGTSPQQLSEDLTKLLDQRESSAAS